MFGFISKKALKNYIEQVKVGNRASNLGQNHEQPISEKQKLENVYAQGYEDGTDNFYNAVCSKFNIERLRGVMDPMKKVKRKKKLKDSINHKTKMIEIIEEMLLSL